MPLPRETTTLPPADNQLLESYRAEAIASGLSLPLPTVPAPPGGLLASLPPAPANRTGWPWTLQSDPASSLAEKSPRVSIVVPSYNQAAFLEETLRSVLLQNLPSLELIVIDGGSTDDSAAIIEKYRPWLSYAHSRRDRGQGHAINLGFALASGDIVGWLNSDDFYLPDSLSRVSRLFSSDPRLELVYGDSLYLNETDSRGLIYWTSSLALDRYLVYGGIVYSHATFWKKHRTRPIWETMECCVDAELWRRLIPGARRKHLPLPLAQMRGHDASKSIGEKWRRAWQNDYSRLESAYGRNPAPRSPLTLEHRYFQRLYARFLAPLWRKRRAAFLAKLQPHVKLP